MTYRIVVGTDFTPPSRFALRYALDVLGRIPGAVLHLVHVVVVPSLGGDLAKEERLASDALTHLRDTIRAAAAGSEGGERIEREVVHHVRLHTHAARAIEQIALDVSADLVVVGTHHRKGIEKLVLGSVAEDLLRAGRVALLVARPSAFDGMTPTPRLDPPRPGADVHARRADLLESSERITWHGRPSHIAGLL